MRIPLLIAIFRVCDASDVGVHRAFYHEVLTDRVRDEVALYARAALPPRRPDEGRDTKWDGYLAALDSAVVASLGPGSDPNDFTGPSWIPNGVPTAKEVSDRIIKRAKFCLQQPGFFAHHSMVLGVHLGMEKRGDGVWVVHPYVTPRDSEHERAAVLGVAKDICREVGDNVSTMYDGSLKAVPNKKERHKAEVKRLLGEAGIEVGIAHLANDSR